MVDIWLIGTQLVPFVEVMLHTFMDMVEDERDARINHHGKVLTIQDRNKMDEERMVDGGTRENNTLVLKAASHILLVKFIF